jgi:hypothetical protein
VPGEVDDTSKPDCAVTVILPVRAVPAAVKLVPAEAVPYVLEASADPRVTAVSVGAAAVALT